MDEDHVQGNREATELTELGDLGDGLQQHHLPAQTITQKRINFPSCKSYCFSISVKIVFTLPDNKYTIRLSYSNKIGCWRRNNRPNREPRSSPGIYRDQVE